MISCGQISILSRIKQKETGCDAYMRYRHLFGPVLSRRLGISLGVDLVPHKQCTMNCVYCEIGRTSDLQVNRGEYVSKDEIFKELNHYLKPAPKLDYITFSGAGEPTLNSGIGDIIAFIKNGYPQYRLALITNSSLLTEKQVREEIKDIDLIMPSLDAVSNEAFQKINRPCKSLNPQNTVKGLVLFRQESSADMWLEIFIVPGINDNQAELFLLKNAVSIIKPDRIQLNTLDRPGTESWVEKADEEKMQDIATFFLPYKVDIIARYSRVPSPCERMKNSTTPNEGKTADKKKDRLLEERILTTVCRRPCTLEELAIICNCDTDSLKTVVDRLIKKNSILEDKRETGIFYRKKY